MDGVLSLLRTDLPAMLHGIPLEQVLANGKMEKEIKCLLAVAWEKEMPGRRICVLDKDFNGGQLDLLALERSADDPNGSARPKFWIELKCSFLQDKNDASRSAEAACQQVKNTFRQISKAAVDWKEGEMVAKRLSILQKRKNERSISRVKLLEDDLQEIEIFRSALMTCDGYVVHLINACPTNEHGMLPRLVMRKFPRSILSRETLTANLQAIYRASPHHAELRDVVIWPQVTALVVRLRS